jgi:hypothetical protein
LANSRSTLLALDLVAEEGGFLELQVGGGGG